MKKKIYVLLTFLWVSISFLQAQQEKNKILTATNKVALQKIGAEAKIAYEADLDTARKNGWSTTNLLYIAKNGRPIYARNNNIDASNLTKTTIVRNNYGLEGDGFTIGLLEAQETGTSAFPLVAHSDFGGRVTIEIGNGIASRHATHVAGTLIGDSSGPSKGMAPKALVDSYDTAGELSTLTDLANAGILVSNHSYGSRAGYQLDDSQDTGFPLYIPYNRWTWYGSNFNSNSDDELFGIYNGEAVVFDNVTYNAPYYLPVIAAGNSRIDNPMEGSSADDEVRNGINGTYVDYDESIHPPGDGSQSSQITTRANAKNVLTIGALDKSLNLANFSSTGFTDDGRLKPDLVGIGVGLVSASNTGNYTTLSGTSMATPNVAGSLILLQEYHEDKFGSGNFMRSSTLKALAIHTAQDISDQGPDSATGWGLLDAEKAIKTIREASFDLGNSDAQIIEDSITSTNQAKVYNIYVDGNTDLEATIVWTEKAGEPNDLITNRELRNDIDLWITRVSVSNPQTYLPLQPNGNGSTYTDTKNNVEKVIVNNPTPGDYQIVVQHNSASSGNLYNNNTQVFSLVFTGLDDFCHQSINHTASEIPSATYNARDFIQSSTEIKNGRTVNYEAQNKIYLKPGFKATSGCTFSAVPNISCN